MVSGLVKDSFHSPFPPTQSLVLLRPLMSHTLMCKTPAEGSHIKHNITKKAATVPSKPSFLLHCKLIHKLCKSEARAEGKLLSLAVRWEGLPLPSLEVLWGTGMGLGLCFALMLHPQGPTGLVCAPPGASCPPSNDISACCSSTAASAPVPEQSCVKHADVFITKLMAALGACA